MTLHAWGQTVFYEDFSTCNNTGSTSSGTDNIGGVAWSTTVNHAADVNDHWYCNGGMLEARDTNGPASWETGDIDITSCTSGITLSVYVQSVGTMEAWDTGCNSADFFQFEVSYDGGASWVAFSDAINGSTDTGVWLDDCGTCGSPSTAYPVPFCGLQVSGPAIAQDESDFTFSDCISVGVSGTVRLRATCCCWSGTEYWNMDDVTLTCSNCALPVEIGQFDATRTATQAVLNWTTLSEDNNKKFNIQRSVDGAVFYTIGDTKGKLNSSTTVDYEFIDENPLDKPVVYYRLEQVDMNGKKKYSEVKSVKYETADIYYNGSEIVVNFEAEYHKTYTLNIYDLSGKLVHTQQMSESAQLNWNKKGFFLVGIPELGVRKKIAIP